VKFLKVTLFLQEACSGFPIATIVTLKVVTTADSDPENSGYRSEKIQTLHIHNFIFKSYINRFYLPPLLLIVAQFKERGVRMWGFAPVV
jgi:hypothetical protein